MNLPPLHQPLAEARAAYLELIDRSATLTTQRTALIDECDKLKATATAEDAAALRALGDVRLKLELVERDIAALAQQIPAARKALQNGFYVFRHAARDALNKQTEAVRVAASAAMNKAHAPFIPAEKKLSTFSFRLADSDFQPTEDRDLLKHAERMLEAWAEFAEVKP